MKKLLVFALAAATFLTAAPKKPKLVLAIVIDQFRYDYLTRFRSEYHSGFERLLTRGAVFTNARYEHFPTVTAIGHSTFLSGATPSLSGIIGNDWYDREEGRTVTSVSDTKTQLLGGDGGTGSSPRRMLVDTVGDELKMSDNSRSRVIGISLKDRAAILPVGHMADGAFWFDAKSGHFVSSSYYFANLPEWVKAFNDSHPADEYRGVTWLNKTMPAEGKALYPAIDASPFGNELIERLAERALAAAQLGKRDVTDILALSFSSNDYVGHANGPDSPEVHDMSVRSDRLLGKLFQAVDQQVGLENVLIVLTGDHGVAPLPEVNAQRKMPGGRMPLGIVSKTVQAALVKKYGEGSWIVSNAEHSIYLNLELIAQKKLDSAEVNHTAAEAALTIPHVFRAYTREQLMTGGAMEDQVARRVMNGFYVRRGPDVEVLLEPYWIFSQSGATHGTTFSYDAHVPIIFMGSGIKAGHYYGQIAVNDIAPTLAQILDVETPSGSVGRVLSEMFTPDVPVRPVASK
jgi:predicted AlkP superfamily pyrophosphatase or phosphodiesterase